MCIYFRDKIGLTYKGREHIFPAAIGGIEKLPKGYVSDEANNYFAKLENELTHISTVSLCRSFLGPGKRGTGKKGKAVVSVMKLDDGNEPRLGYIFAGKPYVIHQIVVSEKEGKILIDRSEYDQYQDLKCCGPYFINKLKQFLEKNDLRFTYIYDAGLNNKLLIGYANDNLFVASSNIEMKVDDVKKEMLKIINSIKYRKDGIEVEASNVAYCGKVSESVDAARAYAKIAFNVLAKIKGKEYINNDNFNGIREWILGENDVEFNCLPCKGMENIDKILPPYAHYCIFTNINNNLFACVKLYIFLRIFNFGSIMGDDFKTPDGMICDWKHHKEYNLLNFIHEKLGH